MAIVYRNVKGSPLSADEHDQNINEILAIATHRANHTGTQLASTIADFASAVENLELISGTSGIRTKLDLLTNFTTPVDVGALVAKSHNPVSIISTNANGLFINAQQELGLNLASSIANGALSSTDWNRFNNKISSATSLGTSAGKQDVYTGQIGTTLRFKSLVGTNGITLTSTPSEIAIGLSETISNSLRIGKYEIDVNTMRGSTTVLTTLPANATVFFIKTKVKVVANDTVDIAISYGSEVLLSSGIIKPQELGQAVHFDFVISNPLPTDLKATLSPSLASQGLIQVYLGYIL